MEGMVLLLHMGDMAHILMADMDINSHTLDMALPMLELVRLLYMVVTVPDLLMDMVLVTADTDLVLPMDMDLHTADPARMDMRLRMLDLDLAQKTAVMENYIDSFVAVYRDFVLIFCCYLFFPYSYCSCL